MNIEQKIFIAIIVMMVIAIGPIDLIVFLATLMGYAALWAVVSFVLGVVIFIAAQCYKHLGRS